jgi:hypothetical protein
MGSSAGAPFAPEGSAPLLPVLPVPAGKIAPGQMADYEVAPASASDSLRMGTPDKLALVQQTLQTADPNMIHVINVDTRYGIVSVMRHPLTVTAAEIMKATTPAGAYAMLVSLPKMPEVVARGIVREVRTAADLMQIFLLDAAMPGMPASFKEMGLLEMPDAPYAVSSRAMEPPGSVSSDPLTPPAGVAVGWGDAGAAGGDSGGDGGAPDSGLGAGSGGDFGGAPADQGGGEFPTRATLGVPVDRGFCQ